MTWRFAALLFSTACGRLGFDDPELEPPGPRPVPEETLACGSHAQFSIGQTAELFHSLRAVATPTGFAVFAVDGGSNLLGWTYDWNSGSLVTGKDRVKIATEARDALGVVKLGNDIVVASSDATAAKTRFLSLGPDLAPRNAADPISVRDVVAAEVPLAFDESGTQLAFLTYSDDSTVPDILVRPINAKGEDLATPVKVAASAEIVREARIETGKNGYSITWRSEIRKEPCPVDPAGGGSGSAAPAPHCNRMALYDRSMALMTGPLTTSQSFERSTVQGTSEWSADHYLVAWYEKDAGNDIWYEIRDANFDTVTAPQMIKSAVQPRLSSDATGFFASWRTSDNPPRIAAATIGFDGTLKPQAVTTLGGSTVDQVIVERNGQNVLTWIEGVVDGEASLWIQPLCR